ncbi:hypothetical protein MDAP_001449 [Mitosporidium daphniae]
MNLFEYIGAWADQKRIEREIGLLGSNRLLSLDPHPLCNRNRLDQVTLYPSRKLSLPPTLSNPSQIILCSALTKKYESAGEAILFSNDSSRFEEAFLLLKQACIQGISMNAISALGFCYEFGLGTCTNYSLAESAYVLAAEKGNVPLAQSRMSFLRKYGRPGLPIDKNEAEHWADTLAAHGSVGALSWLNRAAQNDLGAALYCLGVCYHDGLGCAKDEIKAFALYKRAADQGLSRAFGILGYCFGEGFGVEKDFSQSIFYYQKAVEDVSSPIDTMAQREFHKILKRQFITTKDFEKAVYYYKLAADAGNAYAQSALGYFYEYGIGGLPVNTQQAVSLYRLAAEQGYPWAQSNLGYCYQQGIGLPKDASLAVWWYAKAATQGHPRALHNLGHCYQSGEGVPRDLEKAFLLFEKSAAQGHLFAFHSLGHCYQNGFGVLVNPSEAYSWYLKASECGHGPAQLSLAYCYKNGIGCEKNLQKCLHWFERAAQNGVALAQNIMGSLCELGLHETFIPKDARAAVEWYQKAAAQDLSYAICNLGYCYERGNGIEQCYRTAFKLYESAAFKGHSRAMDRLGLFYLEGRGTASDSELATLWFKRSAQAGYALGMLHYGEALEEGSGVSQSTSEALQWYQLAASKGRKEALDKLRILLLKLSREDSGDIILYGHIACAA